MVIDYSKWDKLELSDDSDVEVHPNVDKKSFIRWKQRDIHEKREQMKHNIEQLEVSTEMNTDLLKRIDQLISVGEKGEEKLSGDIASAVAIANRGFDKDKPESATADEQHNYTEMLENLMEQVRDGVKDAEDKEKATLQKIKEHRQKLDDVLKDQFKQLEELREERSKHILSEDIHTGFDSTQITHKPKETEKKKQTKEQVEVLNPGAEGPSSSTPPPPQQQQKSAAEAEEDDEVQASPDTLEFGKIAIGEYSKCYAYLTSHPNIISEQEKDGLMMEAFQQQLAGNEVSMRRIVHNALLIQYCHTLGPDGVRMFFSKINDKNHPAYNAFIKDVDFTVNHIKQRCEVISQERQDQQENVEQIQLHAVDPNTEIVVNVPDSTNPDAMAVYNSFSTEMRTAIESKQLDEINKVLAEMSVEDAEELVKKFDECGVLSVEEKIYDATEWQKEKQRLQEEEATTGASNPKVEEMD
jgi:cell division cycle protein 37